MDLQEIIKKLAGNDYYDVFLIQQYNHYNHSFYDKIVIETDTESQCLKLLNILEVKTYNHNIKNHKSYCSITATLLKD